MSWNNIRRIGNFHLQRLFGPWIFSMKIANITAANTTFADFDQYLTCGKDRCWHLHDFQIFKRFQNQRFHMSKNMK